LDNKEKVKLSTKVTIMMAMLLMPSNIHLILNTIKLWIMWSCSDNKTAKIWLKKC